MLEPKTNRTLNDAMQRAHVERANAAREMWSWMFGAFSR
jgi:hypothetical protein